MSTDDELADYWESESDDDAVSENGAVAEWWAQQPESRQAVTR
jgi:hypothetical protein